MGQNNFKNKPLFFLHLLFWMALKLRNTSQKVRVLVQNRSLKRNSLFPAHEVRVYVQDGQSIIHSMVWFLNNLFPLPSWSQGVCPRRTQHNTLSSLVSESSLSITTMKSGCMSKMATPYYPQWSGFWMGCMSKMNTAQYTQWSGFSDSVAWAVSANAGGPKGST